MAKKTKVRLRDTETGEVLVFRTLQETAAYCSKVTGENITLAKVHHALVKGGGLAKGRFGGISYVNEETPTTIATPPTKNETIKDWLFTQFEISPTVLVAEKKLDWYDEELFDDYKSELHERGCKVFWDYAQPESKRHHTRIEVYKKFPEQVKFNDKIQILKGILKDVGLW